MLIDIHGACFIFAYLKMIYHSLHTIDLNLQERIQVCFDSVQPLWVPKKTAQIFLQVQIYNCIF